MIKNKRVAYLLIYIVLVLAYFDTVLRFSFNDNLSPFRITTVICCIILILKCGKQYLKYHLFMVGVALYSLVMVMLWKGSLSAFINHYIHWIFIYTIFISIKYLSNDDEFGEKCFLFLDSMTVFVLIIFYFEYFTGIRFFPDKLAAYNVPSSLFYGINDFASAIMAIGVLYIVKFVYEKNYLHLFKYLLVFVAVTIVGARASMLCLAAALALAVLLKVSEKIERIFLKRMVLLSILCIFCIFAVTAINPKIGDSTFSDLVIKPILQIKNLEVSLFQGSVTVRTTAMVIGIKALIHSYGFGIGLGNATHILSSYNFYALKSMHNMLMQLLTEMGWFSIICFFYVIKKAFKCYRLTDESHTPIYCLIFICLTPLFAIQSSEGLMSIYPFWITYFYVFICCFHLFENNK